MDRLNLSVTSLFFELALSGARTPIQVFRATNISAYPLTIRRVLLSSGSEDFELTDSISYPTVLNSSEWFDVHVDFKARVDGIALGLVEIQTGEDRLPYLVTLKSRTQREPTFGDLYGDVLQRITTEAGLRLAGDNAQATARNQLDAALRSLVQTSIDAEALVRYTVDQGILGRLVVLENSNTNGVDQTARTSIEEERINRINGDTAEAIYRLTVRNDLTNAVADVAASVVSETYARTSQTGAAAGRLDLIEASYQSAGQVQTIADARIAIETAARVTAVSAEALSRTTLAATLRTETDTKVANQAVVQTALVVAETAARVTAFESSASSLLQLTARTSGGRGITPNATFEAGSEGWQTYNISYLTDGSGRTEAVTPVGGYGNIYSKTRFNIETSRVYQLNCHIQTYIAANRIYVGMECYDVNGDYLGNVYPEPISALGTKVWNSIFSGELPPATVPSYVANATKFLHGTVSAKLLVLLNFPEPEPIDGAYNRISYLWLDDITNAQAVNARVTQEITARSDAISAEAARVDALFASFASGGVTIADVNAAVSSEAAARTSAISAEASRVDSIIANYSTTSAVNSLISTANSAEIIARNSAIATAISSEVTRVDSLLATYTTTTGMNAAIGSAVSTAVSAEVTSRNSAIASAVSAEASRIDTIIASYSTTGAMNSAISGAVSTEAGVRAAQDGVLAGLVSTAQATADGVSATASSALSAATDAQGKLVARVLLLADVGTGRAQLTLHADAYGSAGVDIVGDVKINGSLTVDGTITTGKIAYNAVNNALAVETTTALNVPINYGISPGLLGSPATIASPTGSPVRVDVFFLSPGILFGNPTDADTYRYFRPVRVQGGVRTPLDGWAIIPTLSYRTVYLDTPTAGVSVSYQWEFGSTYAGTGSGTWPVTYQMIILTEMKR